MLAIGTRRYAPLLGWVLFTLVSMALPAPFDSAASFGFSMVIVLQIRLLMGDKPRSAATLTFRLLGWVVLACLWLWLLTPLELRTSGLPLLVLLILFEVQAYPRLVYRLSREKRVTADVLTGALAGYVLLGLLAALVTTLLESITPGSFKGLDVSGVEGTNAPVGATSIQQIRFIHLTYFAFVTLTTLGYGDMVPITPLAKLSAILFSLMGPVYMALNMGVLIGRYIQQEPGEP